MLKLNTKDLNKIVTVASTDAEFVGTSLEGSGFEIDIKFLSRSEKQRVQLELIKSNKNITMMELNTHMLLNSIDNIRGVEILDGETPILDKDEAIKSFYELAPQKIIDVLIDVLNENEKVEEEKKSDSEMSLVDSQDGM